MKSKAGIFVVVLLALAGAAAAQFATWSMSPPKLELTGQGARALGMGGAFIGLADDATAISWNPAGLAQLDRPEVSLVGKMEQSRSGFETKQVDVGGNPLPLDPDKSRSQFAANFASVVFPLKLKEKNLALALAVKQQLDMFRLNEVHEPGLYDYKEDWSGSVHSFSLGVAYQLSPKVSLGGAANYWMGSPGAEVSYYDEPSATSESGTIKEPYSGLNFTLGAWGNVKPMKLGAVVHTPLNLKYHDEYSGNLFTDANAPGRVPSSGDWNFKWPFFLGVGAAVEPTQSLTLAADVDYRPFSSATLDTNGIKDTTAHYENLVQVRVGAEYLFLLGRWVVPIRAGFRTDPRVYTGTKITPDTLGNWYFTSDGKQVSGQVFSFGTGFVSKKFQLDGALEYGVTKEPLIWDASFDKNPSAWSWKETTMRFLVSGIVRF